MSSYPVLLPQASTLSEKWKAIPHLSVFFFETTFDDWRPKVFAMDERSKDIQEFTSGLASISDCRDAVGSYAGSILRYLKTPAGMKLMQEAKETIQLCVSAQQRSHAEYQYTNEVAASDFRHRTNLQRNHSRNQVGVAGAGGVMHGDFYF